jgi:hypothetical protein
MAGKKAHQDLLAIANKGNWGRPVNGHHWVPLADVRAWLDLHLPAVARPVLEEIDWDEVAEAVRTSYCQRLKRMIEDVVREKRQLEADLEAASEPVRQAKRSRVE